MSSFGDALKKMLGQSPDPIEDVAADMAKAGILPSSSGYNMWTDPRSGITYPLDPNGVPNFGQPFPPGMQFQTHAFSFHLSVDERSELIDLEREAEAVLKKGKLDIFKSLPAALRQTIVDTLLWDNAVNKMNGLQYMPSERLRELRHRDDMATTSRFSGYPSMHNGTSHFPGMKVKNEKFELPNGISADELIQAHLEASVEEELTGDAQT